MTNFRTRHGGHPPQKPINARSLFGCCLEEMDRALVLEEIGEIVKCKECKKEIRYDGKTWKLKI